MPRYSGKRACFRSAQHIIAIVLGSFLTCSVVTTPGWPQAPTHGWDVLRRAAAANDLPSLSGERARSPLPPDTGRVVYMVRPRDTDRRIVRFLRDHYIVYYRTVPQNGELFVFLPGTWARPAAYQRILDEAAQAGYKAIGLEYPNDTLDPRASAVSQICLRDPDPACSARVRTVRIFGGTADGVIVAPADGLQNRLEKLLSYLAEHEPAGGWSRFLVHGRVAWNLVALGGHLQGAGMAAFLAKTHAVPRVALWSGPGEYVRATRSVAPWLRAPGATPPDRWYGIAHRDEAGVHVLFAVYSALGIPGSPTVADASVPRDTHQFVVTLPPLRGSAGVFLPTIANAYHGSVASDSRTPLDADGRPAYAPVWRAMIGP